MGVRAAKGWDAPLYRLQQRLLLDPLRSGSMEQQCFPRIRECPKRHGRAVDIALIILVRDSEFDRSDWGIATSAFRYTARESKFIASPDPHPIPNAIMPKQSVAIRRKSLRTLMTSSVPDVEQFDLTWTESTRGAFMDLPAPVPTPPPQQDLRTPLAATNIHRTTREATHPASARVEALQ